MILATQLGAEWIAVIAAALAGAVGVLSRALFMAYRQLRKLQREEGVADRKAALEQEAAEAKLRRLPDVERIIQAETEIKELRNDLSRVQGEALAKILDAVHKHADCERRFAAVEQRATSQQEQIAELRQRIATLKGGEHG